MVLRPPVPAPPPIRRHAGGYCVEGPGFYLWGEDPREVTLAARDLLGVASPGPVAGTPDPLDPSGRGSR